MLPPARWSTSQQFQTVRETNDADRASPRGENVKIIVGAFAFLARSTQSYLGIKKAIAVIVSVDRAHFRQFLCAGDA